MDTASPVMSAPLVTTLDQVTSGTIKSNKITTSGRDTTYNVHNYIVNNNIKVFHDIIGFFQFAAQLFVALIGMNQSTGADGRECDEVDVCGIVPQDPSSLPVSNIADRYTRSMLECMVGYPLYEPHPFSQHSNTEYSRSGVSVGDVGFVTEDGDFDILFNVCPPQDGLPVVNPPNLPNGFSLENPEDAETRTIRPFSRGTCIFPPTVKKMESGEYICKGPEGAILELPDGAIEGRAINKGRFEELAKRYGVDWYEYTRTRGRSISNGSLYLVTSFTRCTQWGIAVFDRPGDPGQALTFVSNPLKWKGIGASFTRVSDLNQGDTQNQCVFLRGYKIMIRQDVFDKLPTRQRATRIRGGGGTDFLSKLLFRNRTKTSTVTQSDTVALHANFNSSPVHPSDLINAELLNQNPDVKIALTHDDVWCDLLRDNFPELNPATLVNIARSYRNAVDKYGCVSLEKISESSNNSCPVRFEETKIPDLQGSIHDARVERNPDVSILEQTSTTRRPQSVHHSPGDEDEGKPRISVPSQTLPTIPAPHPLRDGSVLLVPATVDYSTKLQSVDSGDRVVQKAETPPMSSIPSASNHGEIHANSAINQSSLQQGPNISPPLGFRAAQSNTFRTHDLPITPPLTNITSTKRLISDGDARADVLHIHRDSRSRETRDRKISVSIGLATDDYSTKQSIDRGDRVVQEGEAPSISFVPRSLNLNEIHFNSAINPSSLSQWPDITSPLDLRAAQSKAYHIPNLPMDSPPLSPEPSIFNLQLSDSKSDAQVNVVQGILNTGQSSEARVMILCFDGPGNKFGAENSNIYRFFKALAKSDRKNQIVYYHSGIGTHNKYTLITHTANIVTSTISAAFGLHLDEHVKKAYQFIVQNHQPGDKICLFGFSRGAHTARAVAGMVYKVGVLPKESVELVDIAFNIYSTTGYNGYKQSQEFKRTSTRAPGSNVSIEFVGVWDTVSSVGIIPKELPYTSLDYAVKKFRHALSLDEHRAIFRPKVWSETTLLREHELDIDIPVPDIGSNAYADKLNRDDFAYVPPERDLADVKEVWFAGTHTDVGGVSPRSSGLSLLPLWWMIKECILGDTGIIFDLDYLRDDLNFDFDDLLKDIGETKKQIKQYKELKACRDAQLKEMDKNQVSANSTPYTEDVPPHELRYQWLSRHAMDIFDQIFDQLVIFWYFWWLFEIIPMLYTYQDHHGNWVRRRMRNFGRGRYIPVFKNKVLVHSSVKTRITKHGGENQKKTHGLLSTLLDRSRNREKYTPRAYNWDFLQQQNMIEYVD